MTEIKLFLAVVGTILSGFIGGFDQLIITLIVFVTVDYITGILAAIYRKSKTGEGGLNSAIGLQGIIKKVMQLFLVGVVSLLDTLTGFPEPYIRTAVIYFLLANEGISILENVAACGVPVPPFVLKTLDSLKERGGQVGK